MSTTKRITMPRRTQEFDISGTMSSLKKSQNRVSRIAQPVRKAGKSSTVGQFGENRRSRSMDKGLNVASLGVPSTATKKSLNPRSSSATPQRRTPLRNTGYGGLNVDAFSSVTSTVERERCSAESRQIFDYLAQANITDLPKEFIDRGNIKMMSMKQFLIIVAHLLRQIGGSRYKIGANFIEDIMRAISELQCPFTVNKSMLKTPSAPHSVAQITTLLVWLINLVPSPSEWAPTYLQAAEFPSQDFTRSFFQSAIESFHLWNLKKEAEFGEQVDTIVDRLVASKTGGLTQEQVQQQTEQILAKLSDIDANHPKCETREQSFDGVQRDILELQRTEKRLVEETRQLAKQYEQLEQAYYQRQDQYYDYESAIQKLKDQVAKQEMTAQERDKLKALIAHNRNVVSARRNAVACLEAESSNYQITLSRLIKQKINLTADLNTKLFNFSKVVTPEIQYTPIEISLSANDYAELLQDLLEVERQVTDASELQRELSLKLNQEKFHLEQKVADARIMLAPLESKVAIQKERLQNLQEQWEAVISEYASLLMEANDQEHIQDTEKELQQRIEHLQEQLERKRSEIEKLMCEKQQLMEDGLERCRLALETRQRKVVAFHTYLGECEVIMDKIVDVCSGLSQPID